MPTISHDRLRKYGAAIFAAAGFPPDQGQDVTDHLVDSNLVGHDSHGIIRLPGYITAVREGNMKPVGTLKVVRESPVSLVIDAQQMQGIVLAKRRWKWQSNAPRSILSAPSPSIDLRTSAAWERFHQLLPNRTVSACLC